MKKCLFGLAFCLLTSPAFAFQINPGISGSWFNPEKPGHGFSIEITEQGCTQIDGQGCLLAYWFTYTPEGDPLFLVGVGPVDGNTAELTLNHNSGMAFGSFTPSPDAQPWGTLNLRFSDCSSGFARYDSDFQSDEGTPYGTSSFKISRLVGLSGGLCNPAAGIWSGFAAYSQPEDVTQNPFGLVTRDNRAYWWWRSEIDGVLQRVLLTGDLGQVDDHVESSLRAYTMLGGEFDQGGSNVPVDVAFDASLREAITDGSFSGEGGTGTFNMNYEGAFERHASLDRLGRCWGVNFGLATDNPQSFGGDIIIEPDGTMRVDESDRPEEGGLTNRCRIDGRIEAAQGGFNQFNVDITLHSCETTAYNGEYQGVAWLRNIGSAQSNRDAQMLIAAHDDRWALLGQAGRRQASQCPGDG